MDFLKTLFLGIFKKLMVTMVTKGQITEYFRQKLSEIFLTQTQKISIGLIFLFPKFSGGY